MGPETAGLRYSRAAMAKHSAHILELAKVGAEIQLRDMVQEIRYLLDLFPHLRDSFNEEQLPLKVLLAERANPSPTRRTGPTARRRHASAAARRAVSGGTKKDWSARRQSKKG